MGNVKRQLDQSERWAASAPALRVWRIGCALWMALLVGCAGRGAGNSGGPSLPWNRTVPPSVAARQAAGSGAEAAEAASAPVAATPADSRLPLLARLREGPRPSYFQELQRRADAQAQLAEQQRSELERLQDLQRSSDTNLMGRLEDIQRAQLEAQQQQQERERLLAQRQQEALQKVEAARSTAAQLDRDNRELTTRLAQSQQRSQVLEDQVDLLQQRLSDTTAQLADARRDTQLGSERLQALQASQRRAGPATITANNTLMDRLTAVSIPGLDIRQDQDLVRIAIPSDELFMPGTATLRQGAESTVGLAADVILRHYPAQIVGVEAHSDGQPLAGTMWRSQHQLTAAQATAVFDLLAGRYRLDQRQLFVIGHGGNHPRQQSLVPGSEAANRRIELVVYPERYGQR